MAMRHQYMQATHLEADSYLEAGNYAVFGGMNVLLAELGHARQFVEPHVGDAAFVLKGKGLEMCGFLYNEECAVVRGYFSDDIQFAAVKSCFVVAGTPMLFCQKLKTWNLG